MLTRESFEQIVAKIKNVPTLPEAVGKICRLVNNPQASTKQIRDLVKQDVAMAAKMLRMVNSVFYGVKEPVHDLEQALVILGFKTVRSVALSVSVINLFQQKNACFNMRDYWTHAAVSAAVSRDIAERSDACDPELAFIIGLLKELGVLVLAEHAPGECRAIMAVAQEFKLPFHKAAYEVLSTNNAEIGAWLCERWGLDRSIVLTVRHQFSLDPAADQKLISLCHLCDYVCRLNQVLLPGDHDAPALDPQVWSRLGLDKSALVPIMLNAAEEKVKAADFLQIVG
jgi:HD-like signal output (HDOD) protein